MTEVEMFLADLQRADTLQRVSEIRFGLNILYNQRRVTLEEYNQLREAVEQRNRDIIALLNEPARKAESVANRREALTKLRELETLHEQKISEHDAMLEQGKTYAERKALDAEIYDLHLEQSLIMSRFNIRRTARGFR